MAIATELTKLRAIGRAGSLKIAVKFSGCHDGGTQYHCGEPRSRSDIRALRSRR